VDIARRGDRCFRQLDRPGRHARDGRKGIAQYYKLGATRLLIRGYDPRPDAIQYGDELIPRLRELVAAHDAARRPTA
jgi:hypothetical protein